MKVESPPLLALLLLEWSTPPRYRQSLIGDLEEAFGERVNRMGTGGARRWYWGQALRSVAPGLRARMNMTWEDGAMSGWTSSLKLAVRSLGKRPGLSILGVLTLALGIGANTAIFSVIDGSLLRPLPYTDPDRLVYLSDGNDAFGRVGINESIPNMLDLRAESRLLAESAIFTRTNGNLATDERPERVRVLNTSHEMLSVLGVSPRVGRDFLPESDNLGSSPVAIITDETWRARFGGDPDVVGRMTTLDGATIEIIGVLPPGFSFPGAPELLVPLRYVGEEFDRSSRNYNGVGRLAPGATVEALRSELQAIFARLAEEYPGANKGWYAWADPIREFAVPAAGHALFLLAWAVGLVLLIACVNVANLLIVRAESRQREFAVRYSLGATRSALLPLFVSEGLVLSVLGGLAGIVTARWGVDALVSAYGASIPRADQVTLSTAALLVGVATSVLVGVAVGLMPLLRTKPADLTGHLKEGARGSSARGSKLGRALVTAEVALAVVLVSGAGLLTKSVLKIREIDTGIADPDRVLTFMVTLPAATYAEPVAIGSFQDEMLARLQRIPGVLAAAAVNRLPLLGGYNGDISASDADRSAHFVSFRGITSQYFETVGVPLVAGRWLTPEEFKDETAGPVIVNETLAAQLFPGEDPLGRRIGPNWVDGGLRIVGVVGDVLGGDPTSPPPPALYYPANPDPSSEFGVMVRSLGDDPYVLLPTIRREIVGLDAEVPIYQIETLDEIATARLGTRHVAASLFALFAALALLLGSVGIYGVMSYSVSVRSKELGVRLALGASRGAVFGRILRHASRLTLPGIAIGLVLSLLSARALRGLLYGVSELDPTTYVGVAAALMLAAAVASYLPAYRATRVDPVSSMRA